MTAVDSEPRVMHVITGLGTGGAESMLSALVLARTAVGPPDRVVSLVPGGATRRRLSSAGVESTDLGMARRKPDPRGIWRLAKLIENEEPDIVHSWMYHADLVCLFALHASGRRRQTRLYWSLRCSDLDLRCYGLGTRLTVAACARLSRWPDGIIANAKSGRAAHRELGYWPRAFNVIENGIDTDRFFPNPKAGAQIRETLGIASDVPLVAFPARMDPMKDHKTFLTALERLPQVYALAIGEGTETLPDQPRLLRLGRRDDMPDLLAACDIVASSSAFGEGFSNAIGEGMATELIPVATDVGDARRIVGYTGVVVPRRAPELLATAIASVLAQPETTRERSRRRARARVIKEFSLSRAVDAYDELYRNGPESYEAPAPGQR